MNVQGPEISGFVLAGGRSSRLGLDKVLLPWNGQTLLSHAIQRLREVCQTVYVCTDRDDLQQNPSVAGLVSSELLIRDAFPDAGPLAGIVAALEKSQTEWNLFLAVDLPLVPIRLLKALFVHMESHQRVSPGILCVVPLVEGITQPLCGFYNRALAPGLRSALQEGKYKIMLALQEAILSLQKDLVMGNPMPRLELLDVQKFAAAITARPDIQASEWFLNINTPVDWQKARELSSRE